MLERRCFYSSNGGAAWQLRPATRVQIGEPHGKATFCLRAGRVASLMAPPFSPECRLAAACAMWRPHHRRTEGIYAAAGAPLDWPRFLRVARRRAVIGLVHDVLTGARLDVPKSPKRSA